MAVVRDHCARGFDRYGNLVACPSGSAVLVDLWVLPPFVPIAGPTLTGTFRYEHLGGTNLGAYAAAPTYFATLPEVQKFVAGGLAFVSHLTDLGRNASSRYELLVQRFALGSPEELGSWISTADITAWLAVADRNVAFDEKVAGWVNPGPGHPPRIWAPPSPSVAVPMTMKYAMQYVAPPAPRRSVIYSSVLLEQEDNRFPHRCPRCGSPAYVGFTAVDCLRGEACR